MLLKNRIKLIKRNYIRDDRGWFLKAIDGKENNLPTHTGEIYLTSAKPGQVKGGHYHLKAKEWFILISGKCNLIIEDVNTLERMSLKLSADNPETVFIPPGIAHSFINNYKKDFLLLAYTDVLYDPLDTIPYNIETT